MQRKSGPSAREPRLDVAYSLVISFFTDFTRISRTCTFVDKHFKHLSVQVIILKCTSQDSILNIVLEPINDVFMFSNKMFKITHR